jgi:hypothetical protein
MMSDNLAQKNNIFFCSELSLTVRYLGLLRFPFSQWREGEGESEREGGVREGEIS